MMSFLNRPTKVAITRVLMVLLASIRVMAQQPSAVAGSSNAANPTPPVPLVELKTSMAEAKALVKSNRVDDAENLLTKHNKFLPSTAEWHLETSQRLMDLARELVQEGSSATIPVLSAQSLLHLNRVAMLTQDPRARAQAKVSVAVIQERFVGDPTAAIGSYEAALQLDPGDAGIKEALERLRAADANLRAKISAAKK